MTNRKQIKWNLLVAMSKRGIRKVVDLQKKLSDVGVEISSQQLGRLVSGPPQRLNMEVLEGLTTVLKCKLEDIMILTDVAEPEEKEEVSPTGKERPKPPSRRVKSTATEESKRVSAPPKFTVVEPLPKR